MTSLCGNPNDSSEMFSLSHFNNRKNAGLLWRSLCPLLALAFICTAPEAFGQATSKDSKPKTASEAKSRTKSSTKSKTSSGTKSQAGTKSKRDGSAQTGSQGTAKTKSSTGQTASQTTGKAKSGEPSQTEASKTDKAEAKTTDQPKTEPSDQQPQPDSSPSPSPGSVDVSSIKPEDLRGFYNNPPEVQQLLTAALELTEQNLGYVYGSADPARGGMDCSGTIYFLLQKMGTTDVPRSASQQYVWVRRFGAFKPVVSTSLESFELDDLRPGDLLFWTGTYAVDVDPPVTHTMIYLGKARSDGRRLMVGASDGRTFRGAKKYGVSVFDFVIPKGNGKNPMSRFVGYSEIPR
jgi:peptidoglycan DL-endopeptidase CwlO